MTLTCSWAKNQKDKSFKKIIDARLLNIGYICYFLVLLRKGVITFWRMMMVSVSSAVRKRKTAPGVHARTFSVPTGDVFQDPPDTEWEFLARCSLGLVVLHTWPEK